MWKCIKKLDKFRSSGFYCKFCRKDQAGKKIKQDLKKRVFSTRHIVDSKSIRTTEKMRIVAEGQQLVRVDWDSSNLTDQEFKSNIKNRFSKKMDEVDGVIISDYNKGVCTELIINEIINKAKELKFLSLLILKVKNGINIMVLL